MSFSLEDLNKVAHLARIEIPKTELKSMADQLSNILGFVEQMNAIDTDDIAPMAHPMDATQRLREDVITAIDEREKFQSLAPDAEQGFYKVPKVIE